MVQAWNECQNQLNAKFVAQYRVHLLLDNATLSNNFRAVTSWAMLSVFPEQSGLIVIVSCLSFILLKVFCVIAIKFIPKLDEHEKVCLQHCFQHGLQHGSLSFTFCVSIHCVLRTKLEPKSFQQLTQSWQRSDPFWCFMSTRICGPRVQRSSI